MAEKEVVATEVEVVEDKDRTVSNGQDPRPARENNKRVINGKPHNFDWDTKRWSPNQAPVVAPAPAAVHFVAIFRTFRRCKQQVLFQQANLLKQVQGDLSDLASIQSAFYYLHL
jgi:hypothetical protein